MSAHVLTGVKIISKAVFMNKFDKLVTKLAYKITWFIGTPLVYLIHLSRTQLLFQCFHKLHFHGIGCPGNNFTNQYTMYFIQVVFKNSMSSLYNFCHHLYCTLIYHIIHSINDTLLFFRFPSTHQLQMRRMAQKKNGK